MCVEDKVGVEQLSEAVGLVHDADAWQFPLVALIFILDGQVMLGAVLSETVTKTDEELPISQPPPLQLLRTR